MISHNAYCGIINLLTIGRIVRLRKPRIDIKDISGMRFGDLTAIEISGKGKHRGSVWLCKCDCGKECKAFGGHLREGTRKSCGCRSEKRIFETGINRVFANYKRKSALRHLDFTITREEFEILVTNNCSYCGTEPGNELKRLKTKKLQIKYNGIDRLDPSKGYISGNCVPCCYHCNHGKCDFSFDQWKLHLKRIFNHLGFSNGV